MKITRKKGHSIIFLLLICLQLNLFGVPSYSPDTILLSLEPSSITTPLYASDEEVTLFKVEIQIYDVEDLASWEFNFEYNETVITFWHAEINENVLLQTDEYSGTVFKGNFTFNSYTGTDVLWKLYFKANRLGSTPIEIINSKLRDKNTNIMPHIIINSEIEVVPLSAGINQEYDELLQEYEYLENQYSTLLELYDSLLATQDNSENNSSNIEIKLANLQSKYDYLINEYNLTLSRIEELEANLTVSQFEKHDITTQLNDLKNDYDILFEEYQLVLNEKSDKTAIPGFPIISIILSLSFVLHFLQATHKLKT